MELMEFFEASNKAQNIADLTGYLYQALAEYGYDRCLCIATDNHRPDTLTVPGGTPRYTLEYVENYKKNNCAIVDPVLKVLPRINAPFTWEQVHQMPLGKKQKEVMNLRRDLIPGRVLMLPIRHRDPRMVGMGIAGPSAEARINTAALSQLYAISNQFYSCYAHLTDAGELELDEFKLSPREKEILQLCARGMNNSAIAELLTISAKTVEFHLSSIFRKMDVSNRTGAALKAANLGLIVTQ